MYKPRFMKREVIVFRRFQRKGYSVFASLGREIVISVLSVATLSSANAVSISMETFRVTDTAYVSREQRLDGIDVTGSQAPQALGQAARMVTVLSHDDIQGAPVQSVNDLLKLTVGIDVRQRGPSGIQTDIGVRGGTQEQTAILLNGINIGDPQTAHNVLDLPIDVSDIERIEVLEGPAARVVGAPSLTGAINIVTHSGRGGMPQADDKEVTATKATVNLEGGSYGYAKAGFSLNSQPSLLFSHLSASYRRSDGYSHSRNGRLNTGFSGSKAFYHGSYDNDCMNISWHVGLADKGWGSGTFYATPRWQADEQYEHTTKLFTAIQAETKHGWLKLRPTIYWNRYSDRYEGYHDQPQTMPYNYNRCDIIGAGLDGDISWAAGHTAIGAELRREDLLSANLGEPLEEPHHIWGTARDYTLGICRTNLTAHLEHSILLTRFTLAAGIVATCSSLSPLTSHLSRPTFYPGIDASLRLSSNMKVYASLNTSLRRPSFTEMYYKLQGYSANPQLKAEEMMAIEAGMKWLAPAVQLTACLWHHHGKNMIDWIMDTRQGAGAEWQSVNHTRLNSFGAEANATWQLSQMIPGQTLFRSVSIGYCYITQDKVEEEGIVSQYALEYLRHKLVAHIDLQPMPQLTARIGLRWHDRVGSYTDFSGEANSYRPYALMDCRVTWSGARHYSIFAEATNLLNNRHYVDYGNVSQPGRWVIAGISLSF
ncbi:MAG: TonB-dependent receptor [Prevotella sp.]|nr:TonB-dependent receptor [Prevotella sp.]